MRAPAILCCLLVLGACAYGKRPGPLSGAALSSAWLAGGWVPKGESCESDAGIIYQPDGKWRALDSSGTWTVKRGWIVTEITATQSEDGRQVAVEPPVEYSRFVEVAGPNEMVVRDERGGTTALQRC